MSDKMTTAGIVCLALIVAMLLLANTAGCGSLAPGYRAITVVTLTGNETGKTLAQTCEIKRKACVEKYGAVMTPELEECLRACHTALDRWVKIVKPAINTSTAAAFGVLETARAAKDRDAPWVAKIKPAVCALADAILAWKGMLGDKAPRLLSAVQTLEGVVCK